MTRIAHQNNFLPMKKATAFHPEPVAPPTADGASLKNIFNQQPLSKGTHTFGLFSALDYQRGGDCSTAVEHKTCD